MPANYTLHPELRLKYVEIAGISHLNEVRSLTERCFEDPQFDITFRQLVNMSGLSATRAKFIDVFTLRNFFMRKYGGVRQPIQMSIVAPEGLGFGFSRMFALLMNGQKTMHVQIFDTMAEALASLDISPCEAAEIIPSYVSDPLLELSPEAF